MMSAYRTCHHSGIACRKKNVPRARGMHSLLQYPYPMNATSSSFCSAYIPTAEVKDSSSDECQRDLECPSRVNQGLPSCPCRAHVCSLLSDVLQHSIVSFK